MNWIKDANKIGRHETTYRGFRVYCTKEPEVNTCIEERDMGTYRVTDFIKGEFMAINSKGDKITGNYLEDIAYKIDFYEFDNSNQIK